MVVSLGLPADDPDLLKGVAGSPFAIRDYFEVCPDYAEDPARRLEEFGALVDRIHAQGLSIILDCVPNHVARSYRSVARPELSFGLQDDRRCDILKDIYDGPKWANDPDDVLGAVAPLHQSLRYGENHDEVRLANPTQWGRRWVVP